jgi:hypothetical protein
MRATARTIVGRETELRSLASFVDEVAAGPSGLLLEGPPGVGKTALWEAGRERAREVGHRVLSARPAQVETAFSYAALGDLLLEHVEEIVDLLPAPQRRALEIALLRKEAGTGPRTSAPSRSPSCAHSRNSASRPPSSWRSMTCSGSIPHRPEC